MNIKQRIAYLKKENNDFRKNFVVPLEKVDVLLKERYKQIISSPRITRVTVDVIRELLILNNFDWITLFKKIRLTNEIIINFHKKFCDLPIWGIIMNNMGLTESDTWFLDAYVKYIYYFGDWEVLLNIFRNKIDIEFGKKYFNEKNKIGNSPWKLCISRGIVKLNILVIEQWKSTMSFDDWLYAMIQLDPNLIINKYKRNIMAAYDLTGQFKSSEIINLIRSK